MAALVKVPRGPSVSLRCTSTSALAERFGVSSRTIERDLRSLQDAGVPLYATAGRRGGYAILPDFALPPVRLSVQEATACLAALALMDRSPYATHARTAADKLAACLPAAVRSAMPVEAVMSVQALQAATTGAWIDALHEHHLVALTYLDDSTPRLVEPYTALEQSRHYDGMEGFYGHLCNLANDYGRDKLANQPLDVRVYCEAAEMMPQLARTCRAYSAPVYSCSGFDSLTAKHDLARDCHDNAFYRGRSTVILHLGDLDPSGVSIYESMREDVLEFIAGDLPHLDPGEVAVFRRVAFIGGMVERFSLHKAPPKKSDGRSARWAGEICQLEALPPDELARILSFTNESVLDLDVLKADREAEAQERRQIARSLPRGGSGAA